MLYLIKNKLTGNGSLEIVRNEWNFFDEHAELFDYLAKEVGLDLGDDPASDPNYDIKLIQDMSNGEPIDVDKIKKALSVNSIDTNVLDMLIDKTVVDFIIKDGVIKLDPHYSVIAE